MRKSFTKVSGTRHSFIGVLLLFLRSPQHSPVWGCRRFKQKGVLAVKYIKENWKQLLVLLAASVIIQVAIQELYKLQ